MKLTKTEHIYTIEGTDEEVRDFKQSMLEKYNDVQYYNTPYDSRVVCTDQKKEYVQCPLCDAQMHYKNGMYWSCYECPGILFEYINNGDAHKVADEIEK